MDDEVAKFTNEQIVPASPGVVGLHHIRIPVADISAAEYWFAQTFGFETVLITEDEDRVTGALIRHDSGLFIGLHGAAEPSAALEGFAVIGLTVSDIELWPSYLDAKGTGRSEVFDGHLGKFLRVYGPNGLVVEIHTPVQPSAEDA